MERDPRLHFVVATALVVKGDKFLILRRAPHEIAFPGKWEGPGGKLVLHEYNTLPKDEGAPQWYNVAEWVLQKEVREEAGVEIHTPQFLCDLVFMRPDGYPVVTLSYWARWKSGEVRLSKDHTEYAWIVPEETSRYDLIRGIDGEIRRVAKLLSRS